MEIKQLTCRGCGEPVSVDMKKCPYCKGPITITTFQNVNDIPYEKFRNYTVSYENSMRQTADKFESSRALAFCYLKLKMYGKAVPCFEQAISENINDSDLFFYAAICLLKGKRPYQTNKKVIDQIIEYLNAACMIEDKGIYHYFLAYVKFDFYDLKKLRIFPNAIEEMNTAQYIGVSPTDAYELFQLLGTPIPNGF